MEVETRHEPAGRSDSLRHILAIAGLRSESSTATMIATDLAEMHDAQLTLVYPLASLNPVLPTGAEAIAQREEYKLGRSRLKQRVQVARHQGVRARAAVHEGSGREAIEAELEDVGVADLVVVPAAKTRGRFDWFSGRLLERMARGIDLPILGVHQGDSLDLKGRPRIAILYREHRAGIQAVVQCARLLPAPARPVFCLYRVASPPTGVDSAIEPEDPQRSADEIGQRGYALAECAVVPTGTEEQLAALRASAIDLVVLPRDARKRPWPLRGDIGRLAPSLDQPVLVH